jgi:hypothetical protein
MGSHLAPARGSDTMATLVIVSCLLGVLSLPSRAQAFCRESTTSAPGGDCDNTAGSVLLHWERDCMTYVFNNQAFTRVPMGETFVRKTFATSFQSWADVQCTKTPQNPYLVAQASGTTSTSAAEFLYDQPNESIIAVRTKGEWVILPDHDSLALALTLIWHDKKTGEILDVDMELNGGAGTFSDCTQGCRSSNIDLQNTVTNEAGHLLGLGHSNVAGATMQPSTTMSPEITKRSLESDDTMGYCACELPAGPCKGSSCTCPGAPIYSSHHSVRACNCDALGQSSPNQAHAVFSLAVLGASAWHLRRRRRQARKVCKA